MELYQQIICEAVIQAVSPTLGIDSEKLVEMKCYQTISKIYEVLSDETLDDPECFLRIEKIVCAMDELGIGGGGRHDF